VTVIGFGLAYVVHRKMRPQLRSSSNRTASAPMTYVAQECKRQHPIYDSHACA
jgi:hypothetical protein